MTLSVLLLRDAEELYHTDLKTFKLLYFAIIEHMINSFIAVIIQNRFSLFFIQQFFIKYQNSN